MLTTSPGAELSRLIRFFEQAPGKPKPLVSHACLVVSANPDPNDPMGATIVEAEPHTVRHTIHQGYDGTDEKICVFRPMQLTQQQQADVLAEMNSYVGAVYGYVKLLACAGDFLMLGHDVFRRACALNKYPICSWEVAWAFDKVRTNYFGVSKDACEPSDIWNRIISNIGQESNIGHEFIFIWQRGNLYMP
jgi:hypothetical protein